MSNFDSLSRRRIGLKEQIDKLNAQLSERKSELAEIDTEILDVLQEQGQDAVRANGYSFSVKKQDVYNASDWADFCAFAEENNCAHLFQKRLTQAAVAEAVNIYGDAVPVNTFTKVSINVRKVPSST